MKVAVIGCGAMGGGHARLLAELDAVDEVLVVDAVETRARDLSREIGGRALSHDDALDEADAVVVATPAPLHAASVEAAVARRLPALCEKPVTDDLERTARLVALVESADAHVEVGFHRRHDPAYLAARARLADGGLGRVHLLRLTAYDPMFTRLPTDWDDNDAAPLFLHSSIHDFDFVRWLSGQEVIEVTADGSRRDDPRPEDPRGIETAVVTLRLSGGTLATLEATWLHRSGYDSRAEVVAEGGHLSMGLSPRAPVEHLDWPLADGPDPWPGYLDRFDRAYRAEHVAFLAAARGERRPASTLRDGLEAHRLAIAATRSYLERRTVGLAEIGGALEREVA